MIWPPVIQKIKVSYPLPTDTPADIKKQVQSLTNKIPALRMRLREERKQRKRYATRHKTTKAWMKGVVK